LYTYILFGQVCVEQYSNVSWYVLLVITGHNQPPAKFEVCWYKCSPVIIRTSFCVKYYNDLDLWPDYLNICAVSPCKVWGMLVQVLSSDQSDKFYNIQINRRVQSNFHLILWCFMIAINFTVQTSRFRCLEANRVTRGWRLGHGLVACRLHWGLTWSTACI